MQAKEAGSRYAQGVLSLPPPLHVGGRVRAPHRARLQAFLEADARTRTADPFITSEVLYQLSYVGKPGIA